MDARRLVLIRHAKAADGQVDAERELTERGRSDAAAVGRWFADSGLGAPRVVVSPARRAVQTWELAAAASVAAPSPGLDARVYDNTLEALLEIIRETPPAVEVLALVGHNPSVEELAGHLDDGHGEAAARQELARKYPTSGVAVFELTGPWAQVGAGAGTLIDFVIPRD